MWRRKKNEKISEKGRTVEFSSNKDERIKMAHRALKEVPGSWINEDAKDIPIVKNKITEDFTVENEDRLISKECEI